MLCQDIDLDANKFVPVIAESIRQQVIDFESVHEIELPMESQTRVVINVSFFLLCIKKYQIKSVK